MNLEQPRPTPASTQVRASTGNRGAAATGAASIANAHGSQGASGRNTAFVDLLNLLSAEDETLLSEEVTDAVSLTSSVSTNAADVGTLPAAADLQATPAEQAAMAVALAATAGVAAVGEGAEEGTPVLAAASTNDTGQAANLSSARATAQALSDAQRLAGLQAAVQSAAPNQAGATAASASATPAQAATPNVPTAGTGDPLALMQRLKDAGLAELTGAGVAQTAGRAGRGISSVSSANLAASPTASVAATGIARGADMAERLVKLHSQNDMVQAVATASAVASPASSNLAVGIGAAVLTGSGWAMPGLAAMDDSVSRVSASVLETGAVSAAPASESKSGTGQSGSSGSEAGQGVDWGGWSALDATPDREQLASADWTQTLAEQLDKWTSQSAQDAELRIESFGGQPVDIAIQMRDGAAWVEFRSDSSGAREALAQSTEQLRQMLEARGVALGHMSVDSQTGRGAGQDGQGSSRRDGTAPPIQLADSRAADNWLPSQALLPSARSANRAGPRSLDVFA